jgi:hypothetical protein
MQALFMKLGALISTGLVAIVGASPVFAAVAPNASMDASIKAAFTADTPSASVLAKIEAQEDTDQTQIDA